MNDLISRQAAIDAIIAKLDSIDHVPQWVFDELTGVIGDLPSAQPEVAKDTNVPINDCISRQAAIWILDAAWVDGTEYQGHLHERFEKLPSVHQTLYGYDIEHLKLIANVLQKENLPPERVADALMDIGRIVDIVRDEFEETLRKAVEQCMT